MNLQINETNILYNIQIVQIEFKACEPETITAD